MRAARFARHVAGPAIAALVLAAGAGAAHASARTAAAAAATAHGGAEQAYAVGLHPHARARLLAPGGRTLQSKRVDAQGGVLFRDLRPGHGDRITSDGWRSTSLDVLSDRAAPPSHRLYDQRIHAGYGYLTTRDGTQLAIDVHLPHTVPASSLIIGGLKQNDSIIRTSKPYPTLIEYSGYGYANPAGPVNGIADLANLLGFAVVDVSMRGTGCSGGAFDYFDRDESLDGYDAIETIANQPWVLDHKVGMLGISYGGISQLFTAATDPPALEAIAPLSPIDSTIATLYPGGDLNTGFAGTWATQRVQDAEPFSRTFDQSYALKRIREGDQICRANQALHGEAVNLTHEIAQQRYFHPGFDNPLDPVTFVHRIRAATFLACQFTDEETGGHCPDLAEDFSGTRRKWFYFQNGTHTDSLDPETLVRLVDFYELYVAHRKPVLSVDDGDTTVHTGLDAALKLFGPTLLKLVMGIHNGALNDVPADPVETAPSYHAALALFNQTPEVTIGFDNGAAPGNTPGIPLPAFTAGAPSFPLPGTTAQSWYLAPGGALSTVPGTAGTDTFTYRAAEGPATDWHGHNDGAGGLWGLHPRYEWISPTAGQAASFVTTPLAQNTVVVGAGSVSLWVKSTKPAVDLQATITEVRPDGNEVYVQNGYLRGDDSALRKGSTPLQSELSLRRSQLRPLSPDHWTHVTIPLYYEGHAYRAGSRIRVIIASIGGDQPLWSFADPTSPGTAQVTLGYSATLNSALTLPVIPSISVPTPLPAECGALRGEPCRTYQPLINVGS
ncbi:MAG TPA: CocE/NonD family hydrolase [Solirubrobacteraceae bacterium]